MVEANPSSIASASSHELQQLLHPISCEEFVSSYFSHRALFIEGAANKFEHLFSWQKLDQALERGQHIRDKRYNIMASFARGEERGSGKSMFEAPHQQVEKLFKSGATICITNIHMADPTLARWAQTIRAQLNFAGLVGVNCYISPDGAGLSTHYDSRVVTNIQIAGRKRWKYSVEAARPWPDHNAVYQDGRIESVAADAGRSPPEMEFGEVEMKPGDLLCLPAGAWHSAKAGGQSLAINVYFQPRNFLEQLMPVLQNLAAASDEWRAGTPPSLDSVQGELPPGVADYIRQRMDEFQKMALEVANNPQMSVEPWLSAATHVPYTGWTPTPKAPLQGLTDQNRFRIAKSSLRFVRVQDKLVLPCDNSMLKFPIAAGPLLERLAVESGDFTVHDFLAWGVRPEGPDAKKVISYLQILIENRIVEVVG
jgi:ribosomal protein L16 Arg81 hydroxylase